MSSDFPTFAEVGEENVKAREFRHFQRMMKCYPMEYHPRYPRREPE
jgi:hypothetical protein